jgi:hypothetical protein
MRGAVGVALVACLVLASGTVLAADRMVVMEHWTNAGCGPCATYYPYIKAFTENHYEQMVVVSYHVWWPWANDPFYLANVSENTARTNFYSVNSVPHIVLDGRTVPTYPYTTANLEAAWAIVSAVSTNLQIELAGVYLPSSKAGTGRLTARLVTESNPVGTGNRLFMVICENGIAYAAPNGMTEHNWVMRDMFPDSNGIPVTFSPPYPDTIFVTRDFTISPAWNEDNLYFAAFVQSVDGTKKIRQGVRLKFEKLVDITDVAEGDFLLDSPVAGLGQNFPNPCNPATVIPFSLPEAGAVTLSVYDVGGRLVRNLLDSHLERGDYKVAWDGLDARGTPVVSGIYYCRLEAGRTAESQKLVVVR